MRVNYTSCGLIIILTNKDIVTIEETGKLESIIGNRNHQNLVLYLVDKVEEGEDLEAEGFHIKANPLGSNWDTRQGFDVYLSRENLAILLDTNRHGSDVGTYISRSRFDRIEFNYFNV